MRIKLRFVVAMVVLCIGTLVCFVACAPELKADSSSVKNSVYVFGDIELKYAEDKDGTATTMSEEETVAFKEELQNNYYISFFLDKCSDSFGNNYSYSENGRTVDIDKGIKGENYGGVLKLFISDAGKYFGKEQILGLSCELLCYRYEEYKTAQDISEMPDYKAIKENLCDQQNALSELDDNKIKEILTGFDINNCKFYLETKISGGSIYICGITSGKNGSNVDYVYFQDLCESYCLNGDFYYNFGAYWVEADFEEYNKLYSNLKKFDNNYFYDLVRLSQKTDEINGFISAYGDVVNYLRINEGIIVLETEIGDASDKLILSWGEEDSAISIPIIEEGTPDISEIDDPDVAEYLERIDEFDKFNFTATETGVGAETEWSVTYFFDSLNDEVIYKRVSDKEGDEPVLYGQGLFVYTPESYPYPVNYADSNEVRQLCTITPEILMMYDLSVEEDRLVCKSSRGEVRLTVKTEGEKIVIEGKLGSSFVSRKIEIYNFGTTIVEFPEEI